MGDGEEIEESGEEERVYECHDSMLESVVSVTRKFMSSSTSSTDSGVDFPYISFMLVDLPPIGVQRSCSPPGGCIYLHWDL